MAQVIHPDVSNSDLDEIGETDPPWATWHPEGRMASSPAWLYDYDERVAPGFEDTVRQLFHMTLASLRGYREISRLVVDPELQTFVEVVVHQRGAQCRALAQMSHSLYRQLALMGPEDESLADPGAANLQVVWLRAIWSFEQDEFGRFADNIEQAESMLEDAYLSAANTFPNSGVAAIYRQFALNICGARQRLEELVGNLVRD